MRRRRYEEEACGLTPPPVARQQHAAFHGHSPGLGASPSCVFITAFLFLASCAFLFNIFRHFELIFSSILPHNNAYPSHVPN
jgi:hypothetical protein